MKADGDARSVCAMKLDWLAPKWYGSVEEMLAFGAACRATKNWWAGRTPLAAGAHFRNAARLAGTEMVKYLSTHEVWTEIKLVYDEYLTHHPHADVERSKYATLCYLARHYLEAHAQFEALGDRLTAWPHFPNYPLENLKKIRDEVAQIDAKGTARRRSHWRVDSSTPAITKVGGVSRFPVPMCRRQEGGILGLRRATTSPAPRGGITYTIRVHFVPAEAKSGRGEAGPGCRGATRSPKSTPAWSVDEHAANLGEYLRPGRQDRSPPSLRPAIVRVRSGVIGNRLYELSVRTSETDISGPAATTFLDSFKFQR